MEKNTYKSDLQEKELRKKLVTTARFVLCQRFTNCSQPSKTTDFTTDSSKRNQKTRDNLDVLTKRATIWQHTDCWNRNAGSGVPKCGSISHVSLWNTLEKCGIESHHINFLRRLYAEQKGTVSTDTDSDMFEKKRGTKQGDPLSSLLLHMVLEMAMKDTCWWIGGRIFSKTKQKRGPN